MITPLILNIGTGEIIVVAAVALLIFGGEKLPGVMRSLGKGVKSLKKGLEGVEDEIKEAVDASGVEDLKKEVSGLKGTIEDTIEEDVSDEK